MTPPDGEEFGPRDENGKRQTRLVTRKMTPLESIDAELAEIEEFEQRFESARRL